jgi:predicted kinase
VGRPRAIFLIGFPGAGKSTWAEAYRPGPGNPTTVVSTDRLIERHAAAEGLSYAAAYRALPARRLEAQARRRVREAVERGWDVVLDRTNLRASTRARFLRLLPPEYVRVAVVFAAPWAELERRLEARGAATGKRVGVGVLPQMATIYDPPTAGEFDLVEYVRG